MQRSFSNKNRLINCAPDFYYNNSREEMLRFVPISANRIADIGCACGKFSQLLKKRKPVEIWGIEINTSAASVAESHLDKVINKDINLALPDLPYKYFDCIIFNDVLEHLENPYKLLKDIKKHLTPKGVVVASIPNVRYIKVLFDLIIRKKWDYVDEGVLDKTHLRFFTLKSIIKMFVNQGYEVKKIEGLSPIKPLTFKIIFKILDLILVGPLDDIQYMQFACVAKPF